MRMYFPEQGCISEYSGSNSISSNRVELVRCLPIYLTMVIYLNFLGDNLNCAKSVSTIQRSLNKEADTERKKAK